MTKGGLFIFVTGLSRLSCFLGSVSLIAGLLLSLLSVPARAAGSDDDVISSQDPQPTEEQTCTPPGNWDKTVRAKDGRVVNWRVKVKEDDINLRLKFFWYQDYSKEGCPFDCSTGQCQDHETGTIEALGKSYEVSDPGLGPNEDSVTLKFEDMDAGTYEVTFTHNGNGHSINIGLKSSFSTGPTDTPPPPPTDSPTETSTPTHTLIPPTETDTPSATYTFTPTVTGTQPTATATATGTHLPPTSTPTHLPPSPTGTQPTPTATGSPEPTNKPPLPSTTASPTPESPVRTKTASPTPDSPVHTRTPAPTATPGSPTPPATLAPPTPPAGTDLPAILAPVTGADLRQRTPDLYPRLLLHLGIGLLGIGLVCHGIKTHLKTSRVPRP